MSREPNTRRSLAVLERYIRRMLSESERQYQTWLQRRIKGMRDDH